MKAIAIIPARYGSTRFPGKMLADATGKPLVQHVYEQAAKAKRIERVIVATDDERIASAVERFGGEAVMTRADHPNGSSRLAEVAANLEAELIVNVQGDEPEIAPSLIDRAVDALIEQPQCVVSTIASPFAPDENPANPNIVKVVCDQRGRALYFSRALIPHERDARERDTARGSGRPLKHVGLYVYRREFLLRYVTLPETPLERTEKLEQLRVLEHGEWIAVAVCESKHHGIDTPEQYEAFVKRHRARVSGTSVPPPGAAV
jgi:3-deoxy-manno-octulosonate cytidylyltransferase (CMP-KDO synthetase)